MSGQNIYLLPGILELSTYSQTDVVACRKIHLFATSPYLYWNTHSFIICFYPSSAACRGCERSTIDHNNTILRVKYSSSSTLSVTTALALPIYDLTRWWSWWMAFVMTSYYSTSHRERPAPLGGLGVFSSFILSQLLVFFKCMCILVYLFHHLICRCSCNMIHELVNVDRLIIINISRR